MSKFAAKRKTRNFLLDWRFQLKYTLAVVLFSSIIAAILGSFLYKTQNELLLTHQENSELATLDLFNQDAEIGTKLKEELKQRDLLFKSKQDRVRTSLLAFLGILVVLLGIVGILATHKIAGPAYALTKALRAIGDGKLPEIRDLRKGDELREVGQEMKRMAQALREKAAAELAVLESLRSALENKPEALAQLDHMIAQKKQLLSDPDQTQCSQGAEC